MSKKFEHLENFLILFLIPTLFNHRLQSGLLWKMNSANEIARKDQKLGNVLGQSIQHFWGVRADAHSSQQLMVNWSLVGEVLLDPFGFRLFCKILKTFNFRTSEHVIERCSNGQQVPVFLKLHNCSQMCFANTFPIASFKRQSWKLSMSPSSRI